MENKNQWQRIVQNCARSSIHTFISRSLRNVPYVCFSMFCSVLVCAKNKVYFVIQHAYGVSIAYDLVVCWFYWIILARINDNWNKVSVCAQMDAHTTRTFKPYVFALYNWSGLKIKSSQGKKQTQLKITMNINIFGAVATRQRKQQKHSNTLRLDRMWLAKWYRRLIWKSMRCNRFRCCFFLSHAKNSQVRLSLSFICTVLQFVTQFFVLLCVWNVIEWVSVMLCCSFGICELICCSNKIWFLASFLLNHLAMLPLLHEIAPNFVHLICSMFHLLDVMQWFGAHFYQI